MRDVTTHTPRTPRFGLSSGAGPVKTRGSWERSGGGVTAYQASGRSGCLALSHAGSWPVGNPVETDGRLDPATPLVCPGLDVANAYTEGNA
jgi:hypothetical protein